MSWPALKWMLLKRLPAPQKSTGITLARRQPDDLRPFADAAATLADESGLSLSGFKLAVSGLEAKGLLVIIRQRNRPNLYDLQLASAGHDVTTHEVTSDDVTTHEVIGHQSRGDQHASHEVTTNKHKKQTPKDKHSSPRSRETKKVDPRFGEFVSSLQTYWQTANPGASFDFTAKDGSAVKTLLKSRPALDVKTFQLWLNNRFRSEDVNHGEEFFAWLPRVAKYAGGSLNKYQQPLGGSIDKRTVSPNTKGSPTKADATSANARAVLARFAAGTGSPG